MSDREQRQDDERAIRRRERDGVELIECQCGCGEVFRLGQIHMHRICDQMIADDHMAEHVDPQNGDCNMQAMWALKH